MAKIQRVYLHFSGVVFSVFLILLLLVTSVEAVAYWIPGYYEREYTKYGVAADVDMEMPDLLYVTKEMMAYLRGARDDLRVETTIGGQPMEFFNAREIAHMEDVRGLFMGAVQLRLALLVLMVLLIVGWLVRRADLRSFLPLDFCVGSGLFLAACALVGFLFYTDFTKYFTIFHLIFFDNDLWILDPATDRLINIVPEPFFMDTALRIGLIFFLALSVLFVVCLVLARKQKHLQ
ncbi:MAG: TIGR01906 family membrane protein [Lachnospiraceae bacterium]|jgi:integral membrane protein (TIGR01906 family)|nr:TIGR01906 family membrane protein [Lachnospiraceae bacterium]